MTTLDIKFAVGYRQPDNGEPFPAIVADYREALGEVYFPWVDAPSGRGALGRESGRRDWSVQAVLEEDLAELRRLGVRLDLLFNANCYGGQALARQLEDEVASIIERLGDVCGGPDVVTTTSLAVARVIKTRFPGIETRASVNMRIGDLQAMGYVADLFDGFYLQRDVQRNLAFVRKARAWCEARGKRLCLLANSGCLRYCPGQIFHDNAVAHAAELGDSPAFQGWNPHVCWTLYRDRARMSEFLKSTWIRPEDIHRYRGLVDWVKLATRQHTHPRMVIDAYVSGRFGGNLANLTEPCFASAWAPEIIDNTAFPEDWAERMAECSGDCDACGYCDQTLQRVLKRG